MFIKKIVGDKRRWRMVKAVERTEAVDGGTRS
jgi:hypothetical protein